MIEEVSYTGDVGFYIKEIEFYEKKFSKWEKRASTIIKRYSDERPDGDSKSQFNILWSNTETLSPAVYAQAPKPNIARRFEDDDELGITASRVLERGASFFIESDEFDASVSQVVLDYLLGGRGQAWVRYVPTFVETEATVDVGEEDEKQEEQVTEDIEEEVAFEDVAIDYVHWKDFGHSWARTWEETRMVWRKVYMSKREVKDRFGEEKANKLEFETRDGEEVVRKKACIYEIWDKVTKQALWISKSCPEELDKEEDPLQLTGFFPCPKPLYSTISNESLVPTPFYIQYQDQAMELDELTARIKAITAAIRVAGVYDKSVQGLSSILTSGYDNKLVPVDSWAMFAEKGGLKGTIDLIPMQEIVQTLISLYEARERVKQDLYEITGISDIVRGISDPRETMGAQKIKGQFATLRLDAMQQDVQKFSRDLVRMITEIIAEHFSPETIKQISGIKLLSEQEKQVIAAQMQQVEQAQQAMEAMPPQEGKPQPQMPPSPDEEQVKLMKKPAWEDVLGLIGDDMARSFRITVETDSTIKGDQEAEKKDRIEFLSAVSTFMEKSVMLPPELQPMAGDMLMFGVRGFKTGRELEQSMKATLEGLKQKAEQPTPPDPALEAEKEAEKAKNTLEGAKLQIEGQKLNIEEKRLGFEERKMGVEAEQSDKDRVAKTNESLVVNGMPPDYSFNDDRQQFQMLMEKMQQSDQMMAQMMQSMSQTQATIAQGLNQMAQANTAPKRLVRDENGRAVGVETIQ